MPKQVVNGTEPFRSIGNCLSILDLYMVQKVPSGSGLYGAVVHLMLEELAYSSEKLNCVVQHSLCKVPKTSDFANTQRRPGESQGTY